MMPGDSQSKTAAIAADAAVGSCQNCSILHQSLTEYVSSFLALKQKITVSDDTVRLQQQLKELQIQLFALEKKTADYDSVQAELDEKRHAVKAYEQLSKEMEELKQENSNTVAKNKKLEDQLQCLNDLTEKQSLENAQLRREKSAIENDLLKSLASLKKSQAEVEKAEKLREENAQMTNIKDNLENKVGLLKHSIGQKNHQIDQLTKEKLLLEKNIFDLQERLKKLERERCKEYRSTTTQTSAPREPKVDKEKVRMLLQSLWACVEPETKQSADLFHLPEPSSKHVLPSSPQTKQKSNPSKMSPSASQRIGGSNSYSPLKPSPQAQDITKHQVSPQRLSGKKEAFDCKKRKRSPRQRKSEDSTPKSNRPEISFDAIMELFKPMLPCISPLPDLENETEVTEMAIGEKKSHAGPSEDSHILKTEESLNITSPSKDGPKSVLQREEHVDSMDVTTQEFQQVSKEKDSGQNRICAVANLTNKPHKDCEESHSEKDTLSKEETASLSSSPSTSRSNVLAEESQLNAENIIDSCIGDTNSIGAETKNSFEEAEQDIRDKNTNMDVDPSMSDAPNTTGDSADGAEPLGGSDAVEISGDTEGVVVSKSSESLKDNSLTKTVFEVEKSNLDSCQSSTDTTAFKLQENTEVPECTRSSSSDSTSGVSNINLDESLEIAALTQVCGEKDGIAAQKTVKIDVVASDSNTKLTSFTKSPVLKRDDDGLLSDKEYVDSSSETHLTVDVEIEKADSKVVSYSAPLVSDSPEKTTVNCKIMEKNTHLVCRQPSPTCLLPSVKMQILKTDPEKSNTDADTEHSVKNEESPNPHGDMMEKVAAKELSRGETESRCTTSFNKDASATEGQPECSDTCGTVHEMQNSQTINEEKCSSKGSPTAAQTPEFFGHVLSEMGPPLPPVLTPLSTPPKAGKSINPRHAIGKLSFPSPMDCVASPTTPTKALFVPNSQQLSSSSLNSPTPSNGVPSSPLQFGSATPKHALPVPGRLATKANNSSPSSSASPPQENSMRILDTMYPELSARARTLSILRGNVGLGICSSESGTLPTTSDNQVSGFKTISSTSTAFTKTEMRGEKRPAVSLPQPEKSKCSKLETSSADVAHEHVPPPTSSSGEKTTSPHTPRTDQFKSRTTPPSAEAAEQDLLPTALEKIKNQCFDLLPVVQSHLYVGNLPKKPVLRDKEKEVISEICESSLVDDIIMAILNKLKAEKTLLSSNYMQALCRVYTGVCRQKKYWEKAHILAYSILTEDVPDSAKLVLFIVTTWPTVLKHSSLLCQAIHTVTKLKAQEGLLSCLSTFLGWEKNPPCDIEQLIFRTLSELRSGSNQPFTKHSRYGEDLGTEGWEQIFTLHLLCSHKKWKWTYEHVLSNELWPLMNTWVTQPRDQQKPVSDVTVATVLRLIGRLCQLGLKETFISSVVTVANIINTFIRHGQTEGVPWEVQLAAVYCTYDLSPCNPKQALNALAGWRGETTQHVPPAVTSCINQIASISRQVKS
ncbi:little elongation complex subunit 1 [Kryptolebias marmoratus]|uniref:Interactor of little elongation complex ELL subunit 1 n=1 Tax=Kryptolebias marmoratus TaxID=37003 RepID=A0A3Q3BMP5_KRYMA|nr:little elongation complex subunit 1 [Kryptolebias marmoratus]